ncbi:MAG: hypothetical protein IPK26_21330 [Planctomycetes bacterium]|nr:hypothetical protein [Planctomycetota bacterium]
MSSPAPSFRAPYALPPGTPALQDPPERRWLLAAGATALAIACLVAGYLAAVLTG